MHSIDSYVRREPGCEIELPDISSLKGSHCIMTRRTPCKEHDTTAFSAAHWRGGGGGGIGGGGAVVNNSNYFTLFRVNYALLHGVRQRMICLRSQYIRGYDALNLKARTRRRPGCSRINFTRRVNIEQEVRAWASPNPPLMARKKRSFPWKTQLLASLAAALPWQFFAKCIWKISTKYYCDLQALPLNGDHFWFSSKLVSSGKKICFLFPEKKFLLKFSTLLILEKFLNLMCFLDQFFFFFSKIEVLRNFSRNENAAGDTVDLSRTSLTASLTGPPQRLQSQTALAVREQLSFKQQRIISFLRN